MAHLPIGDYGGVGSLADAPCGVAVRPESWACRFWLWLIRYFVTHGYCFRAAGHKPGTWLAIDGVLSAVRLLSPNNRFGYSSSRMWVRSTSQRGPSSQLSR